MRQVSFDLVTPVKLGAIPQQDPLAFELPRAVLQGNQPTVAVNCLGEMALVNLARQRQLERHREGTTFAGDAAQDWTIAAVIANNGRYFLK